MVSFPNAMAVPPFIKILPVFYLCERVFKETLDLVYIKILEGD